MSVLFIGGHPIHFTPAGGANAVSTRSGYFDSNFTSFGLMPGSTAQTANPPAMRWDSLLWKEPATDFWVSFTWRPHVSGTSITPNAHIILFSDPGGTMRLGLRMGGDSSTIKLYKRDNAGTITDIATWTTPVPIPEQINKIDLHIDYSSTGYVQCYRNGSSIGTFSGDTTTNGATELQRLHLSPVVTNGGTGSETIYSEIIVKTTDTRTSRLQRLTNNSAGASQSWTGTAGGVVKTNVNDATFVYSATADQNQLYKPAAVAAGSWNVKAVVITSRSLRGDSGPQNLRHIQRIGGTIYTPGSAFALNPGSFNNDEPTILEANPATSAAWLQADLAPSNLEYGIRSVA